MLHASKEGFDGLRCLLQRDVALPTLLEQAAESRMQLLQCDERRQSGGYVAEHSLGMGAQIEHVSVLGHRGEQGLSSAQGIREPALLNERADSPNLELRHGRSPP